MRITDTARLERLDDQRRRINEEFDLLVQRLREGSVKDDDAIRLEAHRLQVRYSGIISDMIDLLRY